VATWEGHRDGERARASRTLYKADELAGIAMGVQPSGLRSVCSGLIFDHRDVQGGFALLDEVSGAARALEERITAL